MPAPKTMLQGAAKLSGVYPALVRDPLCGYTFRRHRISHADTILLESDTTSAGEERWRGVTL